jgi:thiamine transport system ATP-binding protein
MFQDGQLFPQLSVGRNVAYPLRIRRAPRTETHARVAELLDLVGLSGFAERLPTTLSGGERQRVALARALAASPRLLLLDEPLSALDAGLRQRLAEDLRRILVQSGTTAVMVTHDHEEAFAVADRMAVLRDGRLVQSGTLEAVWSRPADPWTARFLGYAAVVTGRAAAYVWERGGGQGRPPETLALRRSAVRVSPLDDGDDGGASPGATGTLVSARLTPEQWRVVVDVPEVGRLDGVADTTRAVRVGERVRVVLDPARTARLD